MCEIEVSFRSSSDVVALIVLGCTAVWCRGQRYCGAFDGRESAICGRTEWCGGALVSRDCGVADAGVAGALVIKSATLLAPSCNTFLYI
jgi:hypothetical protein